VQVGDAPEHPPDHPVKVELAAGLAVRVTTVPAPKLVPIGLLLSVPVPVPDVLMLEIWLGQRDDQTPPGLLCSKPVEMASICPARIPRHGYKAEVSGPFFPS